MPIQFPACRVVFGILDEKLQEAVFQSANEMRFLNKPELRRAIHRTDAK
jgi:hypothetical protein